MGNIIKIDNGRSREALLDGIRKMKSTDTLELEASVSPYMSKEIISFGPMGGEYTIVGQSVDHCTINALFNIVNAHVHISNVVLDAVSMRFNSAFIQIRNGGKLTLENVVIKADANHSPIQIEKGHLSCSNVTIEYGEDSDKFAIVANASSEVYIEESSIQNGLLVSDGDCEIVSTELYGLQLQMVKNSYLTMQDVRMTVDERYNAIYLVDSNALIEHLIFVNTTYAQSYLISANNSELTVSRSIFDVGHNWIGSHNSQVNIKDMTINSGCLWFDQGSTVKIANSKFTADRLKNSLYFDNSKVELDNITISNPNHFKKTMIFIQNRSELKLNHSELADSLFCLGAVNSKVGIANTKFAGGQLYFIDNAQATFEAVDLICGVDVQTLRIDQSQVSLDKVMMTNPQNSSVDAIHVNNQSRLTINNTMFEAGINWIRCQNSEININESQINDGRIMIAEQSKMIIKNTQFQADLDHIPINISQSSGSLENVRVMNPWQAETVSLQAREQSEIVLSDSEFYNGISLVDSAGAVNFCLLAGTSHFNGAALTSAQLVLQPGTMPYALVAENNSKLAIESLLLKQDSVIQAKHSLIDINAIASKPAENNYILNIIEA